LLTPIAAHSANWLRVDESVRYNTREVRFIDTDTVRKSDADVVYRIRLDTDWSGSVNRIERTVVADCLNRRRFEIVGATDWTERPFKTVYEGTSIGKEVDTACRLASALQAGLEPRHAAAPSLIPNAEYQLTRGDLFLIRTVIAIAVLSLAGWKLYERRKHKPLYSGLWVAAWLFSMSLIAGPPLSQSKTVANDIALSVILSPLWAAIGFLVGYVWRRLRPVAEIVTRPKAAAPPEAQPRQNAKSDGRMSFGDALREYESSERDAELYARLLAETDGDEMKVRARYIATKAAPLGFAPGQHASKQS
jgi:hypothetical protein